MTPREIDGLAMVVGLTRSSGTPGELGALQHVLEGAPGYAERLTGRSPGPDDALAVMSTLPPEVDQVDKFVWAVTLDGLTVGCADVVRAWPSADTAYLGLLLLADAHTGPGLGRAAYRVVEAEVRCWPQIDVLRLSVVAVNAHVLPFWRRMGFAETGEVQPYAHDAVVSTSIVLAKRLTAG